MWLYETLKKNWKVGILGHVPRHTNHIIHYTPKPDNCKLFLRFR